MATGNALLGDVYGSVGDLTLRKVHGTQVVSAKVQKITVRKYSFAQKLVQSALVTFTKFTNVFGTVIEIGWFSSRAKKTPQERFMSQAMAEVKRLARKEKKAVLAETESQARFSAKFFANYIPNKVLLAKGTINQGLFTFDSGSMALVAYNLPGQWPLSTFLNSTYCHQNIYLVICVISISSNRLLQVNDSEDNAAQVFDSVAFNRLYKFKKVTAAMGNTYYRLAQYSWFIESVDPTVHESWLDKRLSEPVYITDFYGSFYNNLPQGMGGVAAFQTNSFVPSKKVVNTKTYFHSVNPQLFGLDWYNMSANYADTYEKITFA